MSIPNPSFTEDVDLARCEYCGQNYIDDGITECQCSPKNELAKNIMELNDIMRFDKKIDSYFKGRN